ncbi:MAG: ChbG/HpnK family deacetylase [Sandaracinaceae bacterium]|nr:ChbG/HpnK family deacetylase [Sandaracinaceae bacterium]
MSTALVITADDLGLDPRRDDGIFDAFARGAITQASFMVTGPSAASAAERARACGLPVGLHLDLTETPPSAPPDQIASLLDAEGAKLGKHGLREALAAGRVERAHVEREARAQLTAFARAFGAPPDHVDGHQHVHAVPALAELLAPVLAEAGVKSTRIPEQREVRVEDPDKARFYRSVADDGARARAIFARAGVGSTEAFVGLDLMGAAASPERLRDAVAACAGAASVELMCHPGYVGVSWDDFNRSPEREHELAVLLAHPFAPLVATGAVRLASFATLLAEGALR